VAKQRDRVALYGSEETRQQQRTGVSVKVVGKWFTVNGGNTENRKLILKTETDRWLAQADSAGYEDTSESSDTDAACKRRGKKEQYSVGSKTGQAFGTGNVPIR